MKNVLIFTIEGDLTSTLVGDIIKYYFKSNPLRINGGDGLDFISYDLGKDEFFFVAHGRCYSINDIHSVWYRKNVNGFNVSDSELIGIEKIKTELGETELFEKNLQNNVIANRKDLFAIFLKMLTMHSKSLGNPFIMGLNKMRILCMAKSIGLTIPNSWIFTKKEDVIKIVNDTSVRSLITKPIEEGFYYFSENYSYNVLTSRVDNYFIESLPKDFPPSFFQEEIKKEFEIRSFYIDGDFYSMAIFSQDDQQTEIDYRNYNLSHPNKVCAYTLPLTVRKKLRRLFNEIGLNCGSVDLIKSVDGDFVFLEINPVGQFGMVSRPCNYNLEYLVAKWLIE
ncbi:grasp-with-spasm system ATP-grasp peptide maturase [Porphyromonas gingivalis]|uniref:grasp-with-spasm system ATP-grasp peptide maturase n=1 Tax=Porphyromonas gingivalis TaxID=837 RepID=UPI000974FCCB|nr:grasp-with-spasm system ATP-grasp peptide maturase [Porphyromonas gingivalis]SJL24237.1 hypothetical protein PGIN_3A1_00295 [Porphyromonas gingivalis]SJL27025.1 hypothetical protein PGIN_84-3_00462 [Porphyromonas gingivalis]